MDLVLEASRVAAFLLIAPCAVWAVREIWTVVRNGIGG